MKDHSIDWEIGRHNWSALRALESAAHIPLAIRSLIKSSSEDAARIAYRQIDNTVVVQGSLYESAVATATCLVMALPLATDSGRERILGVLCEIVGGDAVSGEADDLGWRCRCEISRGVPLYLTFIENGSRMERLYCCDLLSILCEFEVGISARVLYYFERLLEQPDIDDQLSSVLVNSMIQIRSL